MKNNLLGNRQLVCLVAVSLCLASGGSRGLVQAQDRGPKPATTTPPAPAPKIKFRPAATSAPAVRVTGGSRGTNAAAVTLEVLAPNEIGLTTQEKPSLFWFQSKPAEAKLELTLLEENKVEPLLQVKVQRSSKAGVQRLKLSDYDAKLTPGVEYQWVVALVTDAENRSSDLVASGVIKRIEPAADLKQKLAAASPASIPEIYAQAGIWYDALAALSDQIDAHPENAGLREARADLLNQVGLKSAAHSESGTAPIKPR